MRAVCLAREFNVLKRKDAKSQRMKSVLLKCYLFNFNGIEYLIELLQSLRLRVFAFQEYVNKVE